MNVNWKNEESSLLMNPAYSKDAQDSFLKILDAAQGYPGHIWLSTSGSSSLKWVGLAKQALLASAAAVNEHLESSSADRWVQTLPDFHVGGLGIRARAYLSGASLFDFKQVHPGKWNASAFLSYLHETQGTLTALVPAQIHDFVSQQCKPPETLRAVIVGGGALLPEVYEQARRLGWPLLPSYGLTECASQVATASLASLQTDQYPSLQVLSHFRVCEKEGRLCFTGSSLLSTYAFLDDGTVRFVDPKQDGWFLSEDRGSVRDGCLEVFGRADALIKIGGENVDLARLEAYWQTVSSRAGGVDAVLVAMPDARLGRVIHLAAAHSEQERMTVPYEHYQHTVLPFERIRQVHFLPSLPRSPLGKILRQELIDAIGKLTG